MAIEINDLETNRFGVVAAHLSDVSASAAEIESEARSKKVRLLTARVEAGHLSTVHHLENLGFRLMDTLVYFGRRLETGVTVKQVPGLSIRIASEVDAEAVRRVARAAFSGYMGHFHSDPMIHGSTADAIYVDWAGRVVTKSSAREPVLLGLLDGEIIAFIALREVGGPTAEIVLNAVSRDWQRLGIYSTLLGAAVNLALDKNSPHILISTQIQNYAVQRVWTRFGFEHERSVYTLHRWS